MDNTDKIKAARLSLREAHASLSRALLLLDNTQYPDNSTRTEQTVPDMAHAVADDVQAVILSLESIEV